MRNKVLLGSVSALTLVTGFLAAAEGRIPIHGTTTISTPGRYILTRNIGTLSGTTLTINANNVDLDLNGFTVTGGDPAILVQNVRGVAIHDGSISAYEDGITLTNVNDFVLRRLIVDSGEDCAIGITGAGGMVQENLVYGGVRGLCVSGSSIRVANNVVRGAMIDGIQVSGARNHLEGNLITSNSGCGLRFEAGSSGNVYRGNTARGNSSTACCTGGTTDFCDQGTGNSSNGDNFMPSKM